MHYFVTGATGFIGKRLVGKLLAQPDSIVYFLIRKESRKKLPALFAYWNADPDRVIPVDGDLRSHRLGVSDEDMRMLARNISHFFHLAAIYDLEADPESQIETNVGGTRNAIALANAMHAGRFHHASSIAAAGLFEGIFREDMFEEAENLEHPYFSTKHDSERLVRKECEMPWRVYRPGMVVGDSHTGEADKIDGPYYFFKLIQRIRRILPPWMPAIGIEGGRINIVPVDYVVDAMVHIAHQSGLDQQCFHLTDPSPMRVGDVLNTFARAAHAPTMSVRINAALFGFIPDAVRKGLMVLKPVRRLRDAIMKDLGLPDDILQFINYPTRFDNRQAAKALEGSGIACPHLDQYAAKIWDYWERHLDPDLLSIAAWKGRWPGRLRW